MVQGISFDRSSHIRLAPGSDNWSITWADDGHQYSSWGDGGSFGGTGSKGRVSLGVARVEGSATNYQGINRWGGYKPESSAKFGGKSYGIISIDGTLYMWVSPGSNTDNYNEARLYRSTNHGASWQKAGWSFKESEGLVLPAILQFGRDYAGSKDDFVYHYFIELKNNNALAVHRPGRIYLLRVPVEDIFGPKSSYQYFNGLDASGKPKWSSNPDQKQPVFQDSNGVGWTVSVSYNPGLQRYFLMTEHTESFKGNLGVFDAPEPWGPWTTVGYYSNWEKFGSTFYWNFANKWLSSDGEKFTLIFSGIEVNDSWNTITGSFKLASQPAPTPEPAPSQVFTLPGRVQAEDYKAGGPGVAYQDRDTGNAGGAYRSDDVDIQSTDDTGAGYKVMRTAGGEWLAFDVAVSQAGTYDVTARVASGSDATKSFHVEVDGKDVTGTMSFTDSQGYDSFLDVTAPGVGLAEGRHELRFVMHTGYFSFNYLDVTPAVNASSDASPSSLVSNLSVASGKPYEVVIDGLSAGAPLFIDRSFTVTSLPGTVDGASYIKTANDDKRRSENSFLSFQVNQDVTVYVAYDYRAKSLPDWLTGWASTGENIGTTDVKFNLFSKDFVASSQVALGSNLATGASGAGSNYFVVLELD
jgi:hypothetical protein